MRCERSVDTHPAGTRVPDRRPELLKAVTSLKIKTVGALVAVCLVLVAGSVIATTLHTLKDVERIGQVWEHFNTGPGAKAVALDRLRDAIGYGGVVHHFQTFILRKDFSRVRLVRAKLDEAMAALEGYRRLGVNRREAAALADIESVFAAYAQNLETAVAMARDRVSSTGIHRSVRIGDQAAFDGLAVLDEELLKSRRASTAEIDSSVGHVVDYMTGASILIGLSLGLLVAGFFWFTSVRLARPLTALGRAMTELQKGEDTIPIPETERNDEVGAMARAVEVFRQTSIQRRLLQSETAVTNQKLQAEIERHRRTTESLRGAIVRAKAASKAKSAFLAMMSHEIRTPMNGVLGMASSLLGGRLNREQRDQVQIIKESGECLLEILDDILDLSKIEAGKLTLELTDFSLRDLLESTDALWRSRAEAKGLTFKMDLDFEGDDGVHADRTRLRQVLFNLIGNAIKFTESGGITVSLSRPRDDHSRLRFEVADTGIGIADEKKSKLFSPFEQADASTTRKFGGTGLGLAISKQLVEVMGGEIGLDSEAGKGSTFWFTILAEPARTDVAAATEKPDQADASLPKFQRRLRILAAEDNHVNQMVLESILKPLDCELDMVADGMEAFAAVQTKTYDVVLMDVQMPEMDGPTATRHIRALPGKVSQLPIIALTANAMKGDREAYLACGMTEYVSKPINARELFGAILRCCDTELHDGSAAALESAAAAFPEPAGRSAPSAREEQVLGDLLDDIEGLTRDADKFGTR